MKGGACKQGAFTRKLCGRWLSALGHRLLPSLQFYPVTIGGPEWKRFLSLGNQAPWAWVLATPGPGRWPPLGDADRLSSVQSLLPWRGLINVSNGDHESRSSTPPLSLERGRVWGRETHPNEE